MLFCWKRVSGVWEEGMVCEGVDESNRSYLGEEGYCGIACIANEE